MEKQHLTKSIEMLDAIATNENLENQRAHFVILNENIVPIAMNIENSTNYYVQKFRKEYPRLKFSTEYIVESKVNEKIKKKSNSKNIKGKSKFSVQIGSFVNYDLAKSKKTILNNEGFLCRIDEILVDGKVLYSVRIGIFGSHDLARKEQKRLISRIGLYDSIIVELK